jgi:LysR family transcriptional regulator, hydrogen peroxide-inducible genes activator
VLTGPLRLGVIPSVAPYLLPGTLPLLSERYPALELILQESLTRVLLEDVKAGLLDVALLSLPVDDPSLEAIRLFDDPFFLVAPMRPGRLDAPITSADAVGESLILLEEGHCFRDQALQYCGSANIAARRQYGAASLSTIVQMVANGYGTTLLPGIAVDVELGGVSGVAAIDLPEPRPYRRLGLAWRRSSRRKKDFVELGRLLIEARDARSATTEP